MIHYVWDMSHPRFAIWTISILLVLTFWASAQAVVIERVVAVVNEEVITLSELQEESLPFIRRLVREEEDVGRVAPVERRLLEELISRRLQLQEAKKGGIAVTPAEVTAAMEGIKKKSGIASEEAFKAALAQENLTLAKFRKSLEEQLVLDRLVTKEVRSKVVVSEVEVKDYYRDHEDRYRLLPEVRVRHILVNVPPAASEQEVAWARARAEEALVRLQSGQGFAEVARQYSQGPTAQEGGDLGYLKKGEMAPELEREAFALEIGALSGILRSSAGFNIFKVDDKRMDPRRPLEEVREDIKERLLEEKAGLRFEEWIKGLREKAYIEVKL